jgi:hypothetical protein
MPWRFCSDDPGDAADAVVDAIFVERGTRPAKPATGIMVDGLGSKYHDPGAPPRGYRDLGAPVLKIVDGNLYMPFRTLYGMILVKFEMDHIFPFHPRNGKCGDRLGMKTLGHVNNILKNALDVNSRRITRSRDDARFLLQEGPAHGYTMPLEHLV